MAVALLLLESMMSVGSSSQIKSENGLRGKKNKNPIEGTIIGFQPTKVNPHRQFRLMLQVTQIWEKEFYFKFDDGKPIEGFIDSKNRPCAIIDGLSDGEKFIYVSYDNGDWTFVGTLNVEDSNSYWTIMIVIIGGVGGYKLIQIGRRIYMRRYKRKRSDDGVFV